MLLQRNTEKQGLAPVWGYNTLLQHTKNRKQYVMTLPVNTAVASLIDQQLLLTICQLECKLSFYVQWFFTIVVV